MVKHNRCICGASLPEYFEDTKDCPTCHGPVNLATSTIKLRFEHDPRIREEDARAIIGSMREFLSKLGHNCDLRMEM